jgi:predicted MFS family arabinose efflux permease
MGLHERGDDAGGSSPGRDRSLVARHPQLVAVLSAEALSALGDAVFWVGLLVWLVGRPDATGLIAFAAVARLGPRFVFGAAGGVLADRYDRRHLLVGLDLARSVLMIGLAVLVRANASPVAVLALVCLTYLLATPYRPAFTAGVPYVVGERDATAANALDGAVRQVATFLGPLLGTAVLWIGHPSWTFVFDGATFALSAVLLVRLRPLGGTPPAARAHRIGNPAASWFASLRTGVHAVTSQAGLSLMMWLVFVFSVARGFELVLLVLVAQNRLGLGASGVGALSAAIGVGALVAVPLAGRIATVARPAVAVVASLLLTSVPLALLGVIGRPVVAYVVLIAVGVGVVVFEVLAVTLVQRLARVEVLGRVCGIENMAVNGGKLTGALLGPVLVTFFSLSDALLVAALLVVLSALAAVPGLHRVARATLARQRALEPIVHVLAQLALFAGASEPALERLAGTARIATVYSGSELVREGDAPDNIYVIRSGDFEVVKSGRKVATLGRDDWFGEIGLLHDTPRTASVMAATNAEVWEIAGAEFIAAINESASPPAALLEGISARLAQLNDIADHAANRGESRTSRRSDS